jgi:hypothetical protein
MELLSTLLKGASSLLLAISIGWYSLLGGFTTKPAVITILPPPSYTMAAHQATTSSQKVFGTSTPPKIAPAKSPPKAAATVAVPIVPQTLPPAPPRSINAEALNTQTRGGLVNILCMTSGGGVHPVSGSGVFVDSRGVILTNAHIGQFFLLKDYPTQGNVDCVIRTGGPAQPQYHATLLYLPLPWVVANASQLTAPQAKGTGENDYAFLLVTDAVGTVTLPSAFPNLPMTTAEPDTNDSELLAGYPAGFLDGITIEKNLYPTSAYAKVTELYTFGEKNNVDLISIGGTIVSQGGSSGGAVVRTTDGKLEGIIATATSADTTAQRDLRAITIGHIDRSLAAQGQGGVSGLLLSQDLKTRAANFASTLAPQEKDLLIKAIERR